MRIAIAAVLVATGALAYAAGQAAQPEPQQKPTFQASTNVVVVDVTAVDARGKPIKNLAIEDFVVSVDGAPRRVSSAQFIDQAPRPSASTAGARGTLFSTNQSDDMGRLVFLVVDQDTIEPGRLRAPAELIDRLFAGFGPSDKVGLVFLPGPRVVVKPGASKQQIKDALLRTTGSKPTRQVPWMKGSGQPGSTGGFRPLYVGVAEAYKIERGDEPALMGAVNRECTVDRVEQDRTGTKTTQQLFDEAVGPCKQFIVTESRRIVGDTRRETTQFVATLRAMLNGLKSVDAPKILIVLSQGLASPEAPREFVGLDRDAAAARTTIHALRLDTPMFDVQSNSDDAYRFEDRDALRAGLEAMVGRAGGTIFEIAGSAAPAFGRLADEMSGYYLLGLEATGTDRDGKSHKIDVSVQRAGVTVKHRSQFVFEPTDRKAAAARDESSLVLDALQSPVITRDLPVRVTTFNMADDDPLMVRVLVSAEIDRQQERSGTASVGYLIYDDAGKVVVNYYKRSELDRLRSGALRFVTVPSVPGASYTLRIATARNGRVGSVEHRFSASLERAGSLTLGDLILTDAREPGTQLAPPVDGHLSTDRVFGFVQIAAGSGAPKDASFVLELAKDDTTPSLITTPLVAGSARNGIQAVTAPVDVSLLPPGEYRGRLVVSLAGKPVKTLFATLSLDAVPRRATSSAGRGAAAGRADAPRPLPDAVPFSIADVLAPEVVAPFVDELARRSRDLPPAAVEAAKAGRFDEAVAQLKNRTGDATASFARGASLLAKSNAGTLTPADRAKILQAASDAFRETADAAPDSMVSAFYIAACYAGGGKDQQAANAWQTSLAGLDGYPVVYRVLADALGRLGQAERAVSVLDEASTRWPDDETFVRRLARAEIAAGLHEQALTHVESIIAKQPNDQSLIFLALETVYEMSLDASPSRLPALVGKLEQYRGLYVAANGPRQALVDEWIAYLKRRTS